MFGAIIGDIVGSVYEFNNVKRKDFELFKRGSQMTDDSIMSLAVCDILESNKVRDKDFVIDTFKKWGKAFPNAGYGGHFFHWVLGDSREPYNSYGNGSAMRVSAVGWYANNEEEVKEYSRLVTEVTHNHKEGIKGAEVTAMCVFYARTGKSKEFIKDYALSQYPEIGELDYDELVKTYSHEEEICQNTVPQAIYCFLISEDFEDCLRTTISIGGDCDTTAAISCAVAEAYYKYIPEDIYNKAMALIPYGANGLKVRELVCSFLRERAYALTSLTEFNENTKYVSIKYNGEYPSIEWIHSDKINMLAEYLKYEVLLQELASLDPGGICDEALWERDMDEFIPYRVNIDLKHKKILMYLFDLYKHMDFVKTSKELVDIIDAVNDVYAKEYDSYFEIKFHDNAEDAIKYLSKYKKVEVDNAYSNIFNNTYRLD